MPGREIYCTVNLDIWYSIDRGYRPYVPQDQLHNYISYSEHKRRQLSDRLVRQELIKKQLQQEIAERRSQQELAKRQLQQELAERQSRQELANRLL